jgi:hypothetical protein
MFLDCVIGCRGMTHTAFFLQPCQKHYPAVSGEPLSRDLARSAPAFEETNMAAKRKTIKNPGRPMPWRWILILSLFICELFFYTWCRVQCVQVGIAISEQRHRQQELVTMQNSLKIELARLKSPEMIMRAGNHKLGLAMPVPKQTIVLP